MSVWCDRTVTGGILFLILFTPFTFGAVLPWAFSIMEAVLFLLVVVWMAKVLLGSRQGAGNREQESESRGRKSAISHRHTAIPLTPYALPLTLFIGVVLLQLLPLAPSFLRVLSPQTHEFYKQAFPGWPDRMPYGGSERADGESQIAGQESEKADPSAIRYSPFAIAPTWLPLSLAPSLTRTDLLKFVAYFALLLVVLHYPFSRPISKFEIRNSKLTDPRPSTLNSRPPEERFFRSVLLVVLLAGLLVAAAGFVQRFTGNGTILGVLGLTGSGTSVPGGVLRSSGPFVNPDHFANYLSLIFPVALAYALFRTFVVSKQLEAGLRIFSAFTAFIVFTGILLSLSRGGWISTLVGVSILLWFSPLRLEKETLALLDKRRVPAARLSIIVLCFLLVVSLFFIGPGGREGVDTRLGETVTQDTGFRGRATIWIDSLPMVRDFPLFGVGLGAWPELFFRYRRAPWVPNFYPKAHNDYFELLAETGIVGFGLLAWFFFQTGKLLLQGLKRASPRSLPSMAAILAALGAMALHEFLDFGLQIPANAFLFTLLFALALRMVGGRELAPWSTGLYSTGQKAGSKGQRAGSREPESIRHLPSAIRPAFIAVIALVLVFFALRQEQIPYPNNLRDPRSVAEAKEFIKLYPAHAPFHLSLLHLLGDKAPLSRQLSESAAALWVEPTNPYIRDLYASTLLSMGRTDEGLKEMTRSIVDSPSLSNHYYLDGKILPLLSATEKNAVEQGFKKAVARSYPGASDGLAEFYARLGRFLDQGMLYEQAALRENDGPKKYDSLLKAGLAYAKARDPAGAERLWHDVVTTNPADPRAYQYLATVIYGPRKNLSKAKEVVSEGIKNGAPPFSLYLSLAEAAREAGIPEERKAALGSAKTEVEKAAKKGQDLYPLYLLLAGGARRAGDRNEERAALLQALDLRPRSSNTLFRLANLYSLERNFDRAARYLSTIANINPKSADVFYRLAMAEERRYDFPAANKAYARAVELAPDNKNFVNRYKGFKARLEKNRKKKKVESRNER